MNNVTAALPLLLALMLTGCTQNTLDMSAREGLTLEQAKADTQALEQEIAALVPEQYVDRIEQKETSVLMSCRGENNYVWTGRIKVFLTGNPDVHELVDLAAEHFANDGRYRIEEGLDEFDDPFVHAFGPYKSVYIASIWHDDEYFYVASFSECFHLPEGTWTGGSF